MAERTDDDGARVLCAYHEAGHAVAHWILDVPFEKTTVVPSGDAAGHVDAGQWSDDVLFLGGLGGFYTTQIVMPDDEDLLRRERVERQIMTVQAGAIASRRVGVGEEDIEAGTGVWTLTDPLDFGGERLEPGEKVLVEGDARLVVRLLELIGADLETGHLEGWLAHRTALLLDTWWPAVIAVAEALLDRGTLSAAEVAEIAQAAITPGMAP